MERKIGEIFEFGGEWYQCVVAIDGCRECSFRAQDYCTRHSECFSDVRSDGISVIFKKLEKVGEPIIYMSRTFQKLKSPDTERCKYCYFGNQVCNPQLCGEESFLVEIKQNKEDMEEKKVKVSRENWDYLVDKLQYILTDHLHGGESDEVIAEFENLLEIDNPEEKKLDFLPFNLEAAKAGKSVCTRSGHKVRIICFDKKGGTPIVGLIQEDGFETVATFNESGLCLINGAYNLMMLPEKKEGWVNVYKEENNDDEHFTEKVIYKTRKDAFDNAYPKGYVKTIKISWEE